MDVSLIRKVTKAASIFCAGLLFLAVLKLPIEYYRILRIIIFVGAILVILKNLGNHHIWALVFALIAIFFNPIFPIYLYSKSKWIPIDILVGILFLVETYRRKREFKMENRTGESDKGRFDRDRIL